jgi:hypothetical protein
MRFARFGERLQIVDGKVTRRELGRGVLRAV